MRAHEHEAEEASGRQRPEQSRVDAPELARVLQAGAAGRTDVVGRTGMLGLQRTVGNSGVGAMLAEERSPVHDVVGSAGQPLDTDTRADMEARLGHDFGDVRVHHDSSAHDSAVAVNANAYTVGSHVVFQRDRYDPASTEGRTTLAHELTHVVQQRSGPVEGAPAAGGIRVSDPGDRYEREAAATAERAIAAPAPETAAAAPVAAGGPSAVQRAAAAGPEAMAAGAAVAGLPPVQRDAEPAAEEKEEEPAVQGSFVQRDAAPEEAAEEAPEE